jgi:thiol:disulfide interchange protein
LLRLFLLALLAGFGAILTPCVYPIIPLTVTYFMRQTSRSKAVFNGMFFGFSIVIIYTLVGLIVGITRVDLVRLISSHWLPNLLFFLIFIALAFSFFGMFEITLPSNLSTKIDKQADKGGFLGPFFMALATAVISFSCTGPIVGVVLGSALEGEIVRPVVGMLGFSISFALPFTLLAIFPGFLRSMPKSGGWMNTVKVFFAFILLAFSLIFLANLGLSFITRNSILILTMVIFLLLGLYLLGKIKFSHDSDLHHISVPRLLLAIASFSFAIFLIPGLFGTPLKIIEPFLPVNEKAIISNAHSPSQPSDKLQGKGILCNDKPKYSEFLQLPLGLNGYFDYNEALACARKLNKPVLLDFAGHYCKNCKKMYSEVWSDPRVLSILSNSFVIASLYTDDRTVLPEEDWVTSALDGKMKKTLGKKFNDLQITKFGSNALPLYVVVDSEGTILTKEKYYTYSSSIDDFIRFLNDGLISFNRRK